jgi:hypothetical protein
MRARAPALPVFALAFIPISRAIFLIANNSLRVSGHHFLTKLITADKLGAHLKISVGWLELDNGAFATYRVAGKDGAVKLKFHFTGNEIHVAANFGGDRRSQQAMDHQPPVFVERQVMHTLISRDFVEEPNVIFTKRSLPGNRIANFHYPSLFHISGKQARCTKDREDLDHFADTINDPVWWLD